MHYKFFLLTLVTCCITSCSDGGKTALIVRHDFQPIEMDFMSLPTVREVHWKGKKAGVEGIVPGPGTYNTWGYLICDPDELRAMSSKFDWKGALNMLPEFGISLDGSGIDTHFQWRADKKFTTSILSSNVTGEAIADITMGVIYFNVTSN